MKRKIYWPTHLTSIKCGTYLHGKRTKSLEGHREWLQHQHKISSLHLRNLDVDCQKTNTKNKWRLVVQNQHARDNSSTAVPGIMQVQTEREFKEQLTSFTWPSKANSDCIILNNCLPNMLINICLWQCQQHHGAWVQTTAASVNFCYRSAIWHWCLEQVV